MRLRHAEVREAPPAPLPQAHVDEILRFYHRRVIEGEPIAEIRVQSKYFRPEVRRLLDRELEQLTRARTKR